MTAGTGRSAGRVLRRIPSMAVLAGLGLVGALTIVAAALSWWLIAIIGLVLLHLGTALAVVGPWGSRPAPKAPKDSSAKVTSHLVDLERRVDALSARLVASTERTRVELLDALAARAGQEGDRRS
ncbi:hypothetical protein [Ornithinimicrobium faecis]|uniref:Uncharacterized protein n=1 Tax=Ornithinimicrobium faecis TaxID=2934158 RepID=A0ABY4YV31_9MICO|nr:MULTISPECIES: hypothetical protein [unclassified Ornithinimicrobium]USQ80325.1 hypothetical protein NF556_01285 [Ornithinimicrobium sp. HY1793]